MQGRFRFRPPVLIVGAHRSGTTATARALELLGLQIGQHLDSHREPRPLQRVHEKYLHRAGAAWYDPQPFLDHVATEEGKRECVHYLHETVDGAFARAFGYSKTPRGFWLLFRLKLGRPWGWKDPRTTLFAPEWLEIFPEARVIHVLRDPIAAAASIRDRELKFQAAGDPPSGKLQDLSYCVQLVELYVTAGKRLADFPNYRHVHFEDLQASPRDTLAELANFCGLGITAEQLSIAAGTIRPAQIRRPS